MPRGSAVDDVEKKLKREYGGNKRAVYGTLNKVGLMKGSKVTAKGAKPAKMRAAKAKAPKTAKPPKMVKQVGKPKRKKRMMP